MLAKVHPLQPTWIQSQKSLSCFAKLFLCSPWSKRKICFLQNLTWRNGSIHDLKKVLLAITGKDFVLTASDAMTARSIMVMKTGEDKSRSLNKNTLLLYSGESGDAVQFAEYMQKNMQLSSIQHGVDLSPPAVAHFIRREMADSLRTRVFIT
jgi:hypothetical protein